MIKDAIPYIALYGAIIGVVLALLHLFIQTFYWWNDAPKFIIPVLILSIIGVFIVKDEKLKMKCFYGLIISILALVLDYIAVMSHFVI